MGTTKASFGNILSELRNSRYLTQAELADKLDVKRSTLAKWETNKGIPDIDMLKRIAEFFNTTIDFVLFGRNEDGAKLEKTVKSEPWQILKHERQSRGLTQKYVAQRLGFPDSTYISRIESGKRNINLEELRAFAEFFNVTTDYLLCLTDENSSGKDKAIVINIGQKIKALREKRGYTQVDLAKELKVAQNTLSYWENGKSSPDYRTLLKIACFFDVSTDFLLGR